MEVLEVDQWTSTGNIRTRDWEELRRMGIAAIVGGDAEAARRIFGGRFRFREVEEAAEPAIGSVWFQRGPDGFPVHYKAHYDSSD